MTVTDVQKDPDAKQMTITSVFDAPIDRVWQLWENPRLLERWWGPPTYPATFVDHDLSAGGVVTYFMTSPEGEQFHGWWRMLEVDAPRALAFVDGFGNPDDEPKSDLPETSTRVTITEHADGGTQMAIEANFSSLEAMEQLVTMGMEEGMVAALGQIDEILSSENVSG